MILSLNKDILLEIANRLDYTSYGRLSLSCKYILGKILPMRKEMIYQYLLTKDKYVRKICYFCNKNLSLESLTIEYPQSGTDRGIYSICSIRCVTQNLDNRNICPRCKENTYHIAYDKYDETLCYKCDNHSYDNILLSKFKKGKPLKIWIPK